jgi:cytochrome b involved in lipid metabolism
MKASILYAGKDGTDDFEEIGHSNTAKEMLESYYIGEYEVSFVVIISMVLLSEVQGG